MSTHVQIAASVTLGKLDEFMLFLKQNLPNVRGFDGCLRVNVLLNEKDGALDLDEEWISVKHHQTYIASIEENGVLAELASYFDGPPAIQYLDRILI